MRAGLDASTVTPGRTAPELSLTTPPIALPLWAKALGNERSTSRGTAHQRRKVRNIAVPPGARQRGRRASGQMTVASSGPPPASSITCLGNYLMEKDVGYTARV